MPLLETETFEQTTPEMSVRISDFLSRRLAAVALDNLDDNESSFEDAGAYDLMSV